MKNCTGANCPMQYGSVDTATDPATCVAVKECIFATPPKTNADLIRAMSDEELAEFLCGIIVDRYIGVTAEGWVEWLKQEAAEDENS